MQRKGHKVFATVFSGNEIQDFNAIHKNLEIEFTVTDITYESSVINWSNSLPLNFQVGDDAQEILQMVKDKSDAEMDDFKLKLFWYKRVNKHNDADMASSIYAQRGYNFMKIIKTAILFITLTISSLSLQAQSLDITMDKEAKNKIINLFYDTWDNGSRKNYEQVISKNLIDHDRNPMVKMSDYDGMWALLQSLQGLKMKHDIKQIHYLENNKVLVRWTASAKHVGDFFGMPATNKTAYYSGHDILQLDASGQITEMWHIEQIFQLMQQLK